MENTASVEHPQEQLSRPLTDISDSTRIDTLNTRLTALERKHARTDSKVNHALTRNQAIGILSLIAILASLSTLCAVLSGAV
jgi:hypothetical protein